MLKENVQRLSLDYFMLIVSAQRLLTETVETVDELFCSVDVTASLNWSQIMNIYVCSIICYCYLLIFLIVFLGASFVDFITVG